MISPEEIRTVSFERNMRGYRCDDVDAFLQQVAQDVESMTERIETLKKQKEEGDQKLYILAQKIEEYRAEEDTLKTALLNAQRMGENVIHEAKQKAESILREANIKADDLTRDAREQIVEYNLELERVQAEVAHFKADVLGMYRQHIELLSALPGDIEPVEETACEDVQGQASQTETSEPEVIADAVPAEEPNFQPQESPAEQTSGDAWQPAVQHGESDTVDFSAGFFDAQSTSEPEEDTVTDLFSGFQGIKFSD